MLPNELAKGRAETIRANLFAVRQRVARAAERAGRDPHNITICVVTKTATVAEIQAAVDAGATVLGENRVQAASEKIPQIRGAVDWHMIGNLQRNKIRKALDLFSTIQSVESEKLAASIARMAGEMGRRVSVFIEVHTSGEADKHGADVASVPALAAAVADWPQLDLCGLMTMAPFTDDDTRIRRSFATLRATFERIQADLGHRLPSFQHLSMGMTNDFELAIAEGATLVRIGSAIFAE